VLGYVLSFIKDKGYVISCKNFTRSNILTVPFFWLDRQKGFVVEFFHTGENSLMKHIKLFIFALFFAPSALFAASGFEVASQLLAAAKNADIRQVQDLINNGADVNYMDKTGLSIVCTALMNNDVRAAQILQMYGADASKCDQQIKKYNQKKPKSDSGGLFGGLSSAQSMALAAAGAAVVVGGLLLVTDVLGSGGGRGGGGSGSGGTCRPNASCLCGGGTYGTCKNDGTCDCSSTNPGGGTATGTDAMPFGPAMPNAAAETASYASNMDFYSPSTAGITKDNFELMTNAYKQNYLLMMRGYSPLARGYLGMRTLRNANREPVSLTGSNLGPDPVLGGRPVNVALVTSSGINAVADSSLGDTLLPWTSVNAGSVSGGSNDMVSSKYYNNQINRGADNNSTGDDSTQEDAAILGNFDLSNSGTAINNVFSNVFDNMLAKVAGGRSAGYTTADFVGFMPNGQMTIYRTGGGRGMKAANGSVAGTYVDQGDGKVGTGDTLNLFGQTLTLTMDASGSGFTASDGASNTYRGYIGADGLLYVDSSGGGAADKAYKIEAGGNITYSKELGDIDYYNYKALLNAGALWVAGDLAAGRSRPDIVANASVIAPLRGRGVETVSDVLSFDSANDVRKAAFISMVNKYYDRDKTDGAGGANALPGAEAFSFFNQLGSGFSPLVIFSTGAFETDSAWRVKTLEATFENSAPLVFDNLEHLFASVVAVDLNGSGTSGTGSVSGYSPSGKIILSQWTDDNGTSADTSDDKYYKARACGIGGVGAGGIDPWCFAAAGVTDERAVASMAGAAGALTSAFDYLDSKQLFALMALTADGPYLATGSDGKTMTTDQLKSHLQAMYLLPAEYQYRIDQGGEDYLKVFKEVFGYGLINLERATKPTSTIYYYNGNKIVSGSGNAYWRAAVDSPGKTPSEASGKTNFKPNATMRPRGASISAPFYDILESADGSLSLPRIWENEFALGTDAARALYMGDVLGEFRVGREEAPDVQMGGLSFGMSFSDKAYADSMGGLDNMRFGYGAGNIEMGAGYQRHFTDGASRFDGTANPILALASGAMYGSAGYKYGNWSFGARGFSGAVTDESLLENDPTMSSQYEPAKLGLVQGAGAGIAYGNGKFEVAASVGAARESNTVLGAYSGGLLSMGGGDTTYVDTVATYRPARDVNLSLRSTFARTRADADGEFIMGMSDLESNAFSASVDVGDWSFAISRPLAVTRGHLRYAHAQYEVVEDEDGKFDLAVKEAYVRDLDLSPESRELRFSGSYRTQLGPRTHGALGFIYRVNPNNMKDFGNESIFMMKLSHKLGI
jgi:hypothetical protein